MVILRTEDEIRAAGAAAVADWPPLRDDQINTVVALLSPHYAGTRPAPCGRDRDGGDASTQRPTTSRPRAA